MSILGPFWKPLLTYKRALRVQKTPKKGPKNCYFSGTKCLVFEKLTQKHKMDFSKWQNFHFLFLTESENFNFYSEGQKSKLAKGIIFGSKNEVFFFGYFNLKLLCTFVFSIFVKKMIKKVRKIKTPNVRFFFKNTRLFIFSKNTHLFF